MPIVGRVGKDGERAMAGDKKVPMLQTTLGKWGNLEKGMQLCSPFILPGTTSFIVIVTQTNPS